MCALTSADVPNGTLKTQTLHSDCAWAVVDPLRALLCGLLLAGSEDDATPLRHSTIRVARGSPRGGTARCHDAACFWVFQREGGPLTLRDLGPEQCYIAVQ